MMNDIIDELLNDTNTSKVLLDSVHYFTLILTLLTLFQMQLNANVRETWRLIEV